MVIFEPIIYYFRKKILTSLIESYPWISFFDLQAFFIKNHCYKITYKEHHSVILREMDSLLHVEFAFSAVELATFITIRQRSCGSVMFLQMCVWLVHRGSPCDHYPWCIGPHCTAPSTSDLRIPPTPWTSDPGPPGNDIWW